MFSLRSLPSCLQAPLLVLLQDPLSSRSLECLLSLNGGTTDMALLHLHSVLVVPEYSDSEIRLLHPSFHDFLTVPIAV